MTQPCPKCDDMRMVTFTRPDGTRVAEPCECQHERRMNYIYNRIRIPERYRFCTLDNYKHSYPGAHSSLFLAFNKAVGFVDNYFLNKSLPETDGRGLLFTGSIGTGKTHLAVAMLKALAATGVSSALFCDHRELLKSINNSYNPNVLTPEREVLRPVFEAEVLVIDELGSAKRTEWVADIVEHIINTRYNDNKCTILTTNYPNLSSGELVRRKVAERTAARDAKSSAKPAKQQPPAESMDFDAFLSDWDKKTGKAMPPSSPSAGEQDLRPLRPQQPDAPSAAEEELARAIANETLGDRIGDRMRSRVCEMCVEVKLEGADFRQDQKRARF